jgi:hypothetical protein
MPDAPAEQISQGATGQVKVLPLLLPSAIDILFGVPGGDKESAVELLPDGAQAPALEFGVTELGLAVVLANGWWSLGSLWQTDPNPELAAGRWQKMARKDQEN